MIVARPRLRVAPYLAFVRQAMAREATYRFDVFANVGSVLVRVYLLRMVWVALYAHNAAPRELPLHAIVTYSTVALLVGLVMDVDQTRALHERLHDGSIATDFMKPILVPLYYFADGLGEVLFHVLLIVPSLALALLIVRIDVPPPATLAAFGASFLLGYVVGFFVNFLLSSTAFWTLEISAVQMIVTWLTGLLGGELVPLVLFPAAVRPVVQATPFAAMFSTPLSIYVGVIPPERFAGALAGQLAWVVALGLASTFVWRAGARRIVVQGG